MRLRSIEINNYRSIPILKINCQAQEDKSATFGLIGLNEAGKSSILKAIALIGGTQPLIVKEFHIKSQPVEICFEYDLNREKLTELLQYLVVQGFTEIENIDAGEVRFSTNYESFNVTPKHYIIISDKSGELISFEVSTLPPAFVHQPVFWTASDAYLTSKPIDLAAFSANPAEISVPLRNCFVLANIDDISTRIANIQGESTEIEHLQTELGKSVTEHIRSIWPNHPIEITFLITNNQIHFHVKDVGASGKAKTADQRSDGFKQFVSFLLTVSAQNKNEELSNSILLLDEPETHLHPLAQEHLLSELIKITNNARGNVVIFATHSNYMIDKRDLSRNYRVAKKKDITEIDKLDKKTATYASVTYEVFEILSSDYHNELYGRLHEMYQDLDPANEKRSQLKDFDEHYFKVKAGLKKDRPWKGALNEVTLPTYIRNCIHHSDNGNKFSEKELKQSIDLMRKALLTAE